MPVSRFAPSPPPPVSGRAIASATYVLHLAGAPSCIPPTKGDFVLHSASKLDPTIRTSLERQAERFIRWNQGLVLQGFSPEPVPAHLCGLVPDEAPPTPEALCPICGLHEDFLCEGHPEDSLSGEPQDQDGSPMGELSAGEQAEAALPSTAARPEGDRRPLPNNAEAQRPKRRRRRRKRAPDFVAQVAAESRLSPIYGPLPRPSPATVAARVAESRSKAVLRPNPP
jgi:hypothetical protein